MECSICGKIYENSGFNGTCSGLCHDIDTWLSGQYIGDNFENEKVKKHIIKVLMKLPEDIRKKIFDNDFKFIIPHRKYLGHSYHFSIDREKNKALKVTEEEFNLIYLPEWLLEFDDDVISHTIAHEIAHIILKHHIQQTDKSPELAEKGANKLTKEWGFARPKYKKTITLELKG